MSPVPYDVEPGRSGFPLGYRILNVLLFVGLFLFVGVIALSALQSTSKIDPKLIDDFISTYLPSLAGYAAQHSENLPMGALGLLSIIVALPSFGVMLGAVLLRDKFYPGLAEGAVPELGPEEKTPFHTKPMRVLAAGIVGFGVLHWTPIWVRIPVALAVYAFLPQMVDRYLASLPDSSETAPGIEDESEQKTENVESPKPPAPSV